MNAKQAVTTALFALAVAGTAARASASDLWLHVKVHDGKEDSHVTVNLPLSMIEKASALIPSDAHGSGKIKVSGRDMDVAELRQLWEEVQKRPDATYVTVDEKDSKVRIAKRGDYPAAYKALVPVAKSVHDEPSGRTSPAAPFRT